MSSAEGIYLVDSHAKMIWQGNKSLIVKSIEFKKTVGNSFYLIGNNSCYGVIKINSITPMNIAEFSKLSERHKITEKERDEWWTGKQQLYAYEFDLVKIFDPPRRVAVPHGVQTFVKNVEFLSEGTAEMIKDILDYDPSELGIDVLKDDFRIALAWWSSKKQGKEIKYSFEDIENILQLIIEELLARKIIFHPEKMQPFAKEAFMRVWARIHEDSQLEELMEQAFGSPGGKSRVARKLERMVPKHKTYVEAFAGGAALFWKKEQSEREVLNDIDPSIAHSYRFIKEVTPEQVTRLKSFKWNADKALFFRLLKSKEIDSVRKFYAFAYTHFHSYGLSRKTFGYKKNETKIYNRLLRMKPRLRNVFIRCEDYKKVVSEFDSPDTFFFLDPPYPGEWAGHQGTGMWKESDVKEFATVLKSIKGKFLVTINNLPWIRETLSGFKQNVFIVPRSFHKGDTPKRELLVSNYNIYEKKLSDNSIQCKLPEFLSDFTDATIIKDFISVVGSSVEGKEYNDIDVLVRMSEPSSYMKRALEVRIDGMLNTSKNTHFIWGDSEGPHDKFIPVYDLVIQKHKDPVLVEMASGISPMDAFEPMKPLKKFYDVGEVVAYMYGG